MEKKCLLGIGGVLTQNKFYRILDQTDKEYQVLNDRKAKWFYPKNLFENDYYKAEVERTDVISNEGNVVGSKPVVNYEYLTKEEVKALFDPTQIVNSKPKVIVQNKTEELDTPKHYDNSKGTLYKIAQERGWNPYLFDIVKRLERAEKKGEFDTDLDKSINVIKLWKSERNGK